VDSCCMGSGHPSVGSRRGIWSCEKENSQITAG
jgi:hypothetical protein